MKALFQLISGFLLGGLILGGALSVAQDQGAPAPDAPPIAANPALDLVRADLSELAIPVSDLERARKFYEQLGCKVVGTGQSWVSMKGGGLPLRLVQSKDFLADDFPVIVWRTDNLEKLKRRLIDSKFPAMEVPKSKVGSLDLVKTYATHPAVLWNVMKDPDGHVLALVQSGS